MHVRLIKNNMIVMNLINCIEFLPLSRHVAQDIILLFHVIELSIFHIIENTEKLNTLQNFSVVKCSE